MIMKRILKELLCFTLIFTTFFTLQTSKVSAATRNQKEIVTNINTSSKYDRKEIDAYLMQLEKINSSQMINRSNSIASSTYALRAVASTYGTAIPYAYQGSTDINCYGYAGDFNWFIQPGDIGYHYGSPLRQGTIADVNTIASYVMLDYSRAYHTQCRIISSATASINSNERRIAVRVGYDGVVYDYHFLRQCSDGSWCHKPGTLPSQYLGNINPSTYSWNLLYSDGSVYKYNFYNSPTVYIAVSTY